MNRRSFLHQTSAAVLSTITKRSRAASQLPNIIVILADDLGYGDLGCYGSHHHTPNLDGMAKEGVLFRQFYSASSLCSPSRAALMTGRYGVRVGVPHVLVPTDATGLAETETTIAEMVRSAGYRTMCVGKWHLGRPSRYMPTSRGFDSYYGIPYSNDMSPSVLVRNSQVVESPVDLWSLTKRYTEAAVDFIRQSSDTPFFLYLAHNAPHIPLAASAEFAGKSSMGVYGDVIQELDWSVGQILKALKDNDLDQNTLVIFTSDNGPWFQGSPGRLRGRKGDTFEGGMRVPFLARFPGRIPAGKVVDTYATMLDLLPTIAGLTQAPLPVSPLDGADIGGLLGGDGTAPARLPFLYFSGWNLQCARLGRWKIHLARGNTPAFTPEPKVGLYNLRLVNPELYDVDADPEEAVDMSAQNPDVVADLQRRVTQMLPGLPGQVQSAWRDTQQRPVNPNEPGAWPTPG